MFDIRNNKLRFSKTKIINHRLQYDIEMAKHLTLPDGYILENYRKDVHDEDFRDQLVYHTHDYWGIDDSKPATGRGEVQASFRKLTVD